MTTSRIQELIEALEKATGPDDKLDQDIFEHVGGPRWKQALHNASIYAKSPRGVARNKSPRFTGVMDEALSLIPDGLDWAAGTCGENDAPWACLTNQNGNDYAATAATPIIAIIIAALSARAALEGTK